MKRPLQIGDLQGSFLLGKAKRRLYVYFFAIWKVLVEVLVVVDFEVTVTVTVHKTPEVKFEIFTAFVAPTVLAILLVETTLASKFFLAVTSMVTPSFGKVEVTFTLIACVAAKAGKIKLVAESVIAFPSTSTLKTTDASLGVGVGVCVGVGVAASPPLLHEKRINGMATNANFKYFILFILTFCRP